MRAPRFPEQGMMMAKSLVGLPAGVYRRVQLRDPVGEFRVRSGLLPLLSRGAS